jgi:SAM-dependent methyltransferase
VDLVFSYSVLQHLPKDDVRFTLREIGRVLRPGGQCQVQMANAFGVRCLYHQARRHFREATGFEVRYWTPQEMSAAFRVSLGPPQISVDGFFSLNVQPSDLRFLPRKYRMLVRMSESLRELSQVVRPLTYAADSVYVTVRRES